MSKLVNVRQVALPWAFDPVPSWVGQMLPSGAEAVAIAEDNPGQRVENVYDRATGMLIYTGVTDKLLNMQTQVQLTQRR